MLFFVKLLLLSPVFLFPMLVNGQECSPVESVDQAVDYIQHAGNDAKAAHCVQLAFHQIASSGTDRAIQTLVQFLSYRRPLSESERKGIFLHGKGPSVLFPAVHELFSLGDSAEPGLVGFIARGKEAQGIALENALYTLLLIHHGNALDVIQKLHSESTSSTNAEERERLQSAAKDTMKWCDERWKDKCTDALSQ